MPPSPKLLKPIKGTEKKWTKKDRLMVLALLFVTILPAFYFYFKTQGLDISPPPLTEFPLHFSESRIIIEATPSPLPTPKAFLSKDQFLSLTQTLKGSYGLYVYRPKEHSSYGVHDQETFPAASLIKLPILIALYQSAQNGQTDLDQTYVLKDKDRVGGAGNLQYAPTGTKKTYRELAQAMARSSDNTAAQIIANHLGTKTIESTISLIGMTHTSYQNNQTTPADIGLLFQKLYQDKLLKPEHKEELLESLTKTDWEDRIPAGLPQDVRVAHKIGTEIGAWSDAGIVFSSPPFVLVIMTHDALQDEALTVFPQLAKAVYAAEAN